MIARDEAQYDLALRLDEKRRKKTDCIVKRVAVEKRKGKEGFRS